MLAALLLATIPLVSPSLPIPHANAAAKAALATPTCNSVPQSLEIQDPPELFSTKGVLNVTLHLAGDPDPTNIEGICWFYQYPSPQGAATYWIPPTLHVHQGDKLVLTLINEMLPPPTGNAQTPRSRNEQDLGGWNREREDDRSPVGLMCGQPQAVPTPTPDASTGRIFAYHRSPWNETSMHFHGLTVSPKKPSDDVVDVLLCPRKTATETPKQYTYTIDIPRDEPPGLYWYHGHAHGDAERQVLSQLSGAIIIDPVVPTPPEQMRNRVIVIRDVGAPGSARPGLSPFARAVRQYAPSLKQIRETVAKQGLAGADFTPPYRFGTPAQCFPPYRPPGSNAGPDIPHPNTKQLLVNGIPLPLFPDKKSLLPRMHMKVGETEYWRFANIVADTVLDIEWYVNGKPVPLQVVSRDGVPLVQNLGHPTWQAVPMEHVRLSPASRIEFYVTPTETGHMVLRTHKIDSGCLGDAAYERDLIDVFVGPATGNVARRPVPQVHAVDPVRLKFSDLQNVPPVRHRIFAFTEYNRNDEPEPDLYITEVTNPKAVETPFYMHRPPAVTVKSGTVEDWTILNYTQEVHEFHIHQIHFLVMKARGIDYGLNQVLDTIEVPYGGYKDPGGINGDNMTPGAVTLRMDFRDPAIVGEFVYHCHILSHEDNGMMAAIRVAPASGNDVGKNDAERPALPNLPLASVGDRVDLHGLTDQDGHPFPSGDAKGKVLVASFVSTRCPDGFACPLTSGKFAYLQTRIDPSREHLALFTLDPKGNTPATLRNYGGRFGQDHRKWSIVTGGSAQLLALAARLGEPKHGTLRDPDTLVVIGSDGSVRRIVRGDWNPDDAMTSANAVVADEQHKRSTIAWLALGPTLFLPAFLALRRKRRSKTAA